MSQERASSFADTEQRNGPAVSPSAAEAYVQAFQDHYRQWQLDPAARWGGAPLPSPGTLRHTDSSGTD